MKMKDNFFYHFVKAEISFKEQLDSMGVFMYSSIINSYL